MNTCIWRKDFQECLSVSQYYIINNIIMITIFLARSCWLVELWACSISTKENSTLSNILSANPYNHSKVRLHQLVCKHQQQKNFYSVIIHFCACHSSVTRKLYFISSSVLPVLLHPQHFIKITYKLPVKSRSSNWLGHNHPQIWTYQPPTLLYERNWHSRFNLISLNYYIFYFKFCSCIEIYFGINKWFQ